MSKGETTEVSIHPDDITAAIYIVQLNGDEAIESIKTVEKKDVLLLVGVLDRRNTVKEAAKARTALLKDGPRCV